MRGPIEKSELKISELCVWGIDKMAILWWETLCKVNLKKEKGEDSNSHNDTQLVIQRELPEEGWECMYWKMQVLGKWRTLCLHVYTRGSYFWSQKR